MKWIIQSNLLNKEDSEKIKQTCVINHYDYDLITVIPFTTDIPNIPNDQPTIFYGATNFINNIYLNNKWNPGTYFNAENFTVKSYIQHYKNHMINFPCEFTTIKEFAASHQPNDKLFFIRPIKDLKEFAGDVMDFNKIITWERQLRYLPGCDNNPNMNLNTEIAVSEPFNIAHEWRLFIVNGKVSSGSHYRSYMKLNIDSFVPDKVVSFVESMCKLWTPAPVFVMDVGESADNLYIIECNCFNSSGFYNSNISKIVTDISNFIERN